MAPRVTFEGGTLRVSDQRVFSRQRRPLVRALDRELRTIPGVVSARFDLDRGSCEVRWRDSDSSPERAATAFVQALGRAGRTADPSSRRPARPSGDVPGDVGNASEVDSPHAGDFPGVSPLPATIVRGPRRALYVAAGGGCLMMTVVGVVVPGIPTVPFLLGASYFLARSSRTLHAALTATPVVGRVVREWDAHRGISVRSKLTLAGLTVGVVVLTLSITGAAPLVVVIVAAVVSMSLIGIARIPGIKVGAVREQALLPVALPELRLLSLLQPGTDLGAGTRGDRHHPG